MLYICKYYIIIIIITYYIIMNIELLLLHNRFIISTYIHIFMIIFFLQICQFIFDELLHTLSHS